MVNIAESHRSCPEAGVVPKQELSRSRSCPEAGVVPKQELTRSRSCPEAGVVPKQELSRIINDKNWKSAWFKLISEKHGTFIIDSIFWKRPKNTPAININSQKENLPLYWVKNDSYFLKNEEKDILLSQNTWLNDNIMDAAQILICKELGQNIPICSQFGKRKEKHSIENEHIQLMHDGVNHWFLSVFSGSRVQV